MSRVEGFSIFSSLMQRWGHLLNKEVIRLPALKYLTIVFEGWALSHVAERRFVSPPATFGFCATLTIWGSFNALSQD